MADNSEKYVGVKALNSLVGRIKYELEQKIATVKVDGIPLEVEDCAVDIDLATPLSTKDVTVVLLGTPDPGYYLTYSIRQNNVEVGKINVPAGDYEEMSNDTIDSWFTE